MSARPTKGEPRERHTLPDGRVYELEPTGERSWIVLWVNACPECKWTIITPYDESNGHAENCSHARRVVTR